MKKSQIILLIALGAFVIVFLVLAAVAAFILVNKLGTPAQVPSTTTITQQMGTQTATTPEVVDETVEEEGEITVMPAQGRVEITGPFVGMRPDEARALLAGPHSGWLPLPMDPSQAKIFADLDFGGIEITGPAGMEILSPCDGVMDWNKLSSHAMIPSWRDEEYRLGDIACGLNYAQYDTTFTSPPLPGHPAGWREISLYNGDSANYYTVQEMEELGFHPTAAAELHGTEVQLGRLLTRLKVGGKVGIGVSDRALDESGEDYVGIDYKLVPEDLLRTPAGEIVYIRP